MRIGSSLLRLRSLGSLSTGRYYSTLESTVARYGPPAPLVGLPNIHQAAAASALLGPPEIRQWTASTVPQLGPPEMYQPADASAPCSVHDPFIDLMIAKFNLHDPSMEIVKFDDHDRHENMGFTENGSPTFLSTEDPCLDFFFHILPDTPPTSLRQRLTSAWDSNPLTSLKLICHLRGVRGNGKADKESFYTAALWLHNHHPKTLALNIKHISRFGYLKDMPEILYRLHNGNVAQRNSYKGGSVSPELARDLRRKKFIDLTKRAYVRYHRDSDYRFLHDKISDYFAELLLADLESLRAPGSFKRIGLAAKWCPSLDSPYDMNTLLCESIARRVFPRESDPQYAGLEEAHYVYRIRDRLRKEVLSPLRRSLELPEVHMCANQWDILPYERVASVAMKNYKELFEIHDAERFAEFLGRVKLGKAKIAAGALLLHEILREAESEVAELQWKQMVSDVAEKGKLKNCLAVCDVSGSMNGTPIQVCVALGMLVSDLSEEPWKGKVITFSANPQIHRIEGNTLKEKIRFMEGMNWMMNTDFQKVFDRILEIAAHAKLEQDKMIKRVIVFSDMEFDQASANPWETDYEVIKRKFRECGYTGPPELVFWNLRDSGSTPVTMEEKGVALVSGFSKNQLKFFLEEGRWKTPMEVMEAAISGKEYAQLVIFD